MGGFTNGKYYYTIGNCNIDVNVLCLFRYDLNPITVKYHETRPPMYHFLTTVCAIVGGTFTVAGIINSLIFTSMEIFQKFELGKLS